MAARLRHFAVVVRDLEKSAKFYEGVFGLKRVGQETLDFAAAIYLSDGVINLALLNYFGKRGSGLDDAANYVGAHHFGFQVDDLAETQKKIEAMGGKLRLIAEFPDRPPVSISGVADVERGSRRYGTGSGRRRAAMVHPDPSHGRTARKLVRA